MRGGFDGPDFLPAKLAVVCSATKKIVDKHNTMMGFELECRWFKVTCDSADDSDSGLPCKAVLMTIRSGTQTIDVTTECGSNFFGEYQLEFLHKEPMYGGVA